MINCYANYVTGQLSFDKGPSKSGDLIIGNFKNGYWIHNVNKNDCFEIHYEIEINNPNKVKFHIEAPTKNNNTTLNLIKQLMITSITADTLLNQSSQILTNLDPLLSSGCTFHRGGQNDSYNYSNNTINLAPANIETNYSTTVFSIVFPVSSNPEFEIKEVHRHISHLIDKFIFPFIPILSII